MTRRAVAVAAATAAVLAGCAAQARSTQQEPAVPAAHTRAFDAGAAMRLIRLQLAKGQRPAGSPQLRALADELEPLLPHGRFEDLGHGLRNVVGSIPGKQPPILVGAHYDTLATPKGFVGANNGAAGTAIVVQLARTLARARRGPDAPAIDFVLFDGEEPAQGLPEDETDFYDTGLRGSRAYAAHHARPREMLLLDYVANRGLRLPREASSDPALWGRIRRAATKAGVEAVFPDRSEVAIEDDHTPFEREGVPAVDFIDWSYPGHTLRDGYAALSARSADAVGETLMALLDDA